MQLEAIEQQAVMQYAEYKRYIGFAIPNGGRRDTKEAHFLKLSGVKPGVPDMFFPEPRKGYHGLFIELKVGKNKPTEAQEEWMNKLHKRGYAVKVCWGRQQAIDTLEWYFG